MPTTQSGPNSHINTGTYNDVGGNQTIYNFTSSSDILHKLNPVNSHAYHVERCMEGTREEVLEKIKKWLDDDTTTKNMLWIQGSPGSGKSAIASSLTSHLQAQGRLGAWFFFRRGDSALSDPVSMWRTIAAQLANHDDDVASHIRRSLKENRVDPMRSDIQTHFNQLIKQPLLAVENKMTRGER